MEYFNLLASSFVGILDNTHKEHAVPIPVISKIHPEDIAEPGGTRGTIHPANGTVYHLERQRRHQLVQSGQLVGRCARSGNGGEYQFHQQ